MLKLLHCQHTNLAMLLFFMYMEDGKTEPVEGQIIDRTEAAIKKYAENGGKSLSQAMRDVGFSEAYAEQPQKLKKTDKWQKLLQKYLPDKTLAQKHKELLTVGRLETFVFPLSIEDEEIKSVIRDIDGSKFIRISKSPAGKRAYFTAPNADAQLRALELAYKIKGRTQKDQIEDPNANTSQEIREVIFRVRKMLPQGGQ